MTTSALSVFGSTALRVGWRWQTARNECLPPADMETRHLFNTLRMIWNNHMPVDARVGAVRLYRFNPRTHPSRYLGEAIFQIGHELARRPDITDDQRVQLEQMAEYLARRTTLVAGKPPGRETLSPGMLSPPQEISNYA